MNLIYGSFKNTKQIHTKTNNFSQKAEKIPRLNKNIKTLTTKIENKIKKEINSYKYK